MNRKHGKLILLAAASLLTIPPAAFAQGRPAGGSQGGPRQRPGPTQMQKGQMGQRGTADRTRLRASDRQRDQLRTCTQDADRLRTQARDMDRLAKSGVFHAGEARPLRDRMRDQLRTIEQNHEQLMNGLSEEQSTALRNRIDEMNRIRQRVNSRLGEMDQELNKENPDAKQIREQARQIDREMNRWNSQYRSMQTEMGAKE